MSNLPGYPSMVAAFMITTPVAIAAYVGWRWLFLRGEDAQESMLDEYLHSDRGNRNPSRIPPSYTTGLGMIGGNDIKAVPYLDPPELQKLKYEISESSMTTTAKEVRRLRELE